MPVSIPVIIAIALTPFLSVSGAPNLTDAVNADYAVNTTVSPAAAAVVAVSHKSPGAVPHKGYRPAVASAVQPISEEPPTDELDAKSSDDLTTADLIEIANKKMAAIWDKLEQDEAEAKAKAALSNPEGQDSAADEKLLGAVEAVEAGEMSLQGGKWDEELHNVVNPNCHEVNAVPYQSQVKTGFVSYPRSGNSYMRSLIERATGYQTSSICECTARRSSAPGGLTTALQTAIAVWRERSSENAITRPPSSSR